MKKIVTVLAVLFCAVIIFFSIMGEELYYSTKTKVTVERPASLNDELILPESAVFHEADGDYIYTIEVEQGFSTEILTVHSNRVEYFREDDVGYFGEGYLLVKPEERIYGAVVVSASRKLKDGERVAEG